MAGSVYLPVKDASSVIWPFPQWNSKGRGTGRPLAAAVLGMPHSPTAACRGSTAAGGASKIQFRFTERATARMAGPGTYQFVRAALEGKICARPVADAVNRRPFPRPVC